MAQWSQVQDTVSSVEKHFPGSHRIPQPSFLLRLVVQSPAQLRARFLLELCAAGRCRGGEGTWVRLRACLSTTTTTMPYGSVVKRAGHRSPKLETNLGGSDTNTSIFASSVFKSWIDRKQRRFLRCSLRSRYDTDGPLKHATPKLQFCKPVPGFCSPVRIRQQMLNATTALVIALYRDLKPSSNRRVDALS